MTRARRLLVAFFRSFTHSSMLPMLAAWTPQSIRMWAGPSLPGTVSRKKSPKPMRYMRTRIPSLPPTAPPLCPPSAGGLVAAPSRVAGPCRVLGVFAGALDRALFLVLAFALAFVFALGLALARTLVDFRAARLGRDFAAAFLRAAMIRTPR